MGHGQPPFQQPFPPFLGDSYSPPPLARPMFHSPTAVMCGFVCRPTDGRLLCRPHPEVHLQPRHGRLFPQEEDILKRIKDFGWRFG